jgi:hypothetical protein
LCSFFIFPMCATSHAHDILLYLITLTISGEEYKLWSSSLYTFLQHSTNSSLLGLLTLNLCFSLTLRDQVSHPKKKLQHLKYMNSHPFKAIQVNYITIWTITGITCLLYGLCSKIKRT